MQPKLYFFAWVCNMGKILTLDQLQKTELVLANRCCLCQESEKTAHILLHYAKTRALRELLFSLFGVSWVIPFLVRDTLLSWRCSFISKERKSARKAGPLCLFWAIWKVRNDIVFRNEGLSLQKIQVFYCSSFLGKDQIVFCEWSFDPYGFH